MFIHFNKSIIIRRLTQHKQKQLDGKSNKTWVDTNEFNPDFVRAK